MALPYDPDGVQKKLFALRLKDGTNNDNMAVNGSVIPVTFKLAPPADQIWRVATWNISIADAKGFDVAEYGSNGLLANGVEIKGKFGGVVYDLLEFPLRSNGDIASVTYDMTLHTFGNLDDLLLAKWNLTDAGQFIRLDGSVGDELQMVINDDMTFLTHQYVMAKGYIE